MDNNEFSFDALLDSDDFCRRESIETRCALNRLFELVEKNISDAKTVDVIRTTGRDYRRSLFNDAFKQGFCFAVKAIKFMMKI